MMRVARGFTLVELIIVMAIIGLLATIVIPKLASTRNKALIAAMESTAQPSNAAGVLEDRQRQLRHELSGVGVESLHGSDRTVDHPHG